MAKNLEIDLRDPAVQNLLGNDGAGLAAPEGKRTFVHLAGDQEHGLQSKVNLDVGKATVAVLGHDGSYMLELDVHRVEGAPIEVLAICPRCHHAIRITGDRKKIEWDPFAGNPRARELMQRLSPQSQGAAKFGRISIEPFECTWELNTNQSVSGDMTVASNNLCRWRAAIDDNVVKEV